MLVVFVIGSIDPGMLGVAKRVKEYSRDDYAILFAYVGMFSAVVLLPNVVTEASNLLTQLKGDKRRDCMELLSQLTIVGEERYVPSSIAAGQPEFFELGLADAAILCALQDDTHLLTADLGLYLAALYRKYSAEHFGSLR